MHQSLKQLKELAWDDNEKTEPSRTSSDASTTYGELTGKQQEKLLDILAKRYKLKASSLVDIGSGSGLFISYARARGFYRCEGIEVVAQRHKLAKGAITRIAHRGVKR